MNNIIFQETILNTNNLYKFMVSSNQMLMSFPQSSSTQK